MGALVAASDGFTPADIEFAARRASQSALEAALGAGEVGGKTGPSTEDFLEAIGATRATVPPETVAEFLEDIDSIARL